MVNRIIVIGNGFDIAHGVKTSYTDLMNFIEHKVMSDNKRCSENHLHYSDTNKTAHKYLSFILKSGKLEYSQCYGKSVLFTRLYRDKVKFNNWGNVEEKYFECLREIKGNQAKLDILNEEFELLKSLLSEYLIEKESKIDVNQFNPTQLFKSQHPTQEKLIGVVNFNYTSKIVDYYVNNHVDKSRDFSSLPIFNINIHGKLNDDDNPMIFGYGDDDSSEYLEIQNLNNNSFLSNFKTFQYLRNSNYRYIIFTLLKNNPNIKVEIIGHSSSISDKTLLKTIVEHKNVKNIEYRYHSDESKYFNNIHNLSRVFDENITMRDKIIPLSRTRIIPSLEEITIKKSIN